MTVEECLVTHRKLRRSGCLITMIPIEFPRNVIFLYGRRHGQRFICGQQQINSPVVDLFVSTFIKQTSCESVFAEDTNARVSKGIIVRAGCCQKSINRGTRHGFALTSRLKKPITLERQAVCQQKQHFLKIGSGESGLARD